MKLQVIEKSDHKFFVKNLISNYQVEGVKEKRGSFFYGSIRSPDELCLDFDCTVISPKKYFLPSKETLFRFKIGPTHDAAPVFDATQFILFGVHPYDLKAINQMDQIFTRQVPDPHYMIRRKAAIIIGVDPTRVAPRSFWADMEAATTSNGFDLMFSDMGKKFLVEIGSKKGEDILDRYGKVRPATADEIRQRVILRSDITHLSKEQGLSFPYREIPKILERSEEKLLWEEKASKCLSCGTCNLVCPTCYCFDVQDDMSLDLISGERFRRWDGCLLEDFAKVATGENFREARTSRYRHRFFRKGLYLTGVLNDIACVGCGRCASACLPDIADPVSVFNKLKEDEKQGGMRYEPGNSGGISLSTEVGQDLPD